MYRNRFGMAVAEATGAGLEVAVDWAAAGLEAEVAMGWVAAGLEAEDWEVAAAWVAGAGVVVVEGQAEAVQAEGSTCTATQ